MIDHGNELSYHFAGLSKTKDDFTKAITFFQSELEEFRKICRIGKAIGSFKHKSQIFSLPNGRSMFSDDADADMQID